MSEPTPLPSSVHTGRRFQLLERVGTGAFGEVFLANQMSTAGFERKVALKLLHPNRFGETDATRRIRDEARVLGRLHHASIVTVLDLVRLEDQWAVVMEYVDGADLERILKALAKAGRVFPPAAVLGLMAEVADALDAAYNAEGDFGRPLRVVHRDVKPANIRLTPNGDSKVLDFGIARAAMDNREAETGAYVIGTQRYMAPERIAGHGDGPAGDVYSLAATAYELLCAAPLGRSPVLSQRHQQFVRERLQALDTHLHLPADQVSRIAGLLLSCLDAEPVNRPRAADLAVQARRLSRQLPGEDLRSFGRRFVPQVDPLLGYRPDVVSTVLTERTTARHPARGTPDTLRRQAEPHHGSEPARRGWFLPMLGAASAVVIIGAVMLLLGVGAGLGVWWLVRTDRTVEPQIIEVPVEVPVYLEPDPVPASDEPDAGNGAAEPRPATAPAPQASARMVSRAQVAVAGAQGIQVVCGNVKSSGTSSARIMGFPAGECTVYAIVGGVDHQATVRITAPRAIRCTVSNGELACS